MDYEYIILTRKECRRLRKLAKAPHGLNPSPDEVGLMNHGLISRARYGSPDGSSGVPFSTVSSITAEGKNYLAYTAKVTRARRKEHAHNWLIAIFSAICGALLSEPLWDLIRQWAD